MAKLSENTETVVSLAISVSITKVPSTARSPTPSGNAAAIRPPNTITSATKVMGALRRSARLRSFSAWFTSWRVTSAIPVACGRHDEALGC